jgi:hypothetical protein
MAEGTGTGAGAAAAAAAPTNAPKNAPKNTPKNFDPMSFFTKKWAEKESSVFVPPNLPKASHWTDVICDPIGFSQHTGECWNDAFQQIFLFSDGLKDVVQPFLYQTSPEDLAAAVASVDLSDIIGDRNRLPISTDAITTYLQALQARFVNHYNFLKSGDERFDVCVTSKDVLKAVRANVKPASVLKRQASLVFSLAATAPILGYAGEDLNVGGNIRITSWLSLILSRIVLKHNFILVPLTGENNNGSHTAFYLNSYVGGVCKVVTGSDGELFLANKKSGSGHAMAFFVCGGRVYYYDDNHGVYLTSMPSTEIRFVGSVLYHPITSDVIFVKKPYLILKAGFQCGEKSAEKGTAFQASFLPYLTIWSDAGWKKATLADFTAPKQDYFIRYIESKYVLGDYSKSHTIYNCDEDDTDGSVWNNLGGGALILPLRRKTTCKRKRKKNRLSSRRKSTRGPRGI